MIFVFTGMSIFNEVFSIVTEEKDGNKAIIKLLERYDVDHIKQAYTMWVRIRSKITGDPRFENKYYMSRMKELLDSLPPDHQDRTRLCEIMESPLRVRHHAHASKKDGLVDIGVKQTFHSIRPVIAAFYDFAFPEEEGRIAREEKFLRAEDMVLNATTMPKEEMNEIVRKARLIATSIGPNFHDLVTALQILSGRRISEILTSLNVIDGEGFQAQVSGISKINDTDKVFTIPLLCTFDTFLAGIEFIRSLEDVDGNKLCERSTARSSNWQRRTKAFGCKLTHSMMRGIYAEVAYDCRKDSGFLPDAEKTLFKSRALSLSFNPSQQILCYTKISG